MTSAGGVQRSATPASLSRTIVEMLFCDSKINQFETSSLATILITSNEESWPTREDAKRQSSQNLV